MLGTRLLKGFAFTLMLASLTVGCGSQEGIGTPTTGVTRGLADVEQVQLLIMESFPIQVAASARGNLPDGCTQIDRVRSGLDAEDNKFSVEITTVRDSGAVCTQALVPFEERISLDVQGLPAGTYTVDVNGVRDTFTFDVDNEFAEPPSTEVSWDEAQELILGGEVEQVTQLHSREVTLDLRDGRRVVTTEPEIDAVFDVVDACGDPCANMVLATE
jgi:inhibitor of cysteine peptidase